MVAIDEKITKFIIWALYFVGIYFSLFWLSVLIFEDDEEDGKKVRKNWPHVTVILPIYNEEKYISWTLDSVFNLDYPKDKLHVIAVNDGSTDNTLKILKRYKRKVKDYDFVIIDKKNGGKYTALNAGLKRTNTPYFACLDADCYVERYALKLMIPEFSSNKIAAVLPVMKVYNPQNIIQRVQWLEYILNIFYKYMMGKIDCIHVTPGPFTVYRTSIVKKLGGFRKAHLTEDLEMAMRLQKYHYKIKQSLDAVVYTAAPKDVKGFVSQRTRWYQGTILNVKDYKFMLFNKEYGDFGLFHIPLVGLTGFLLLLGVLTVIYLTIKNFYFMIKRWYLTHFDFVTYIKSWHWDFSILNLNWQVLFSSLVMFSIIFFAIYLALTSTKERVSIIKNIKYFLMFLYYFFIYRFLLAYVWFKVLWKLVFKRENKWDKVN